MMIAFDVALLPKSPPIILVGEEYGGNARTATSGSWYTTTRGWVPRKSSPFADPQGKWKNLAAGAVPPRAGPRRNAYRSIQVTRL